MATTATPKAGAPTRETIDPPFAQVWCQQCGVLWDRQHIGIFNPSVHVIACCPACLGAQQGFAGYLTILAASYAASTQAARRSKLAHIDNFFRAHLGKEVTRELFPGPGYNPPTPLVVEFIIQKKL